MKLTPSLAVALAGLVLDLVIIFFLLGGGRAISDTTTMVEQRSKHPLVSPRVFVQNQNDIIINFTALRSELSEYVKAQTDLHAGVYFEYLPSGTSVGVNEKDTFVTASLLKVPFIMGVYKRIEQGAIRKDDVITVSEQDIDPYFGSLWKKGAGTKLTVKEAIDLALRESDNTAVRALDSTLSQDLVHEVYDALDIPGDLTVELPVVSPKNYSSVLRCLYLSCYLSADTSQEILDTMTHSIFTDGMKAGVPDVVPVAHKVGYYDMPNQPDLLESDCGIVYAPKRPYSLCVFVTAPREKEQDITDFMREVSHKVYQYVAGA